MGFFNRLFGGGGGGGSSNQLTAHPHLRRFGITEQYLNICHQDSCQSTATPGDAVSYNPLEMYEMVSQTIQTQGEMGKLIANELFMRWKHGFVGNIEQMPSALRDQTQSMIRAIEDLLK